MYEMLGKHVRMAAGCHVWANEPLVIIAQTQHRD